MRIMILMDHTCTLKTTESGCWQRSNMESKARRISINDWGDRDLSLMLIIHPTFISEIGLDLIDFFAGCYKVIDEQLFMLAVIKHGISYKNLQMRIEIYGNGWGSNSQPLYKI